MSATDCLACHSGDLVGARSDHTYRTKSRMDAANLPLSKPQRAALLRCLDAPGKVPWNTASCLIPGGLLAVHDGKAGLFRTTEAGRARVVAPEGKQP